MIGIKTIGRLQGRAIVRDKDGNVKGELIIDSDLPVENAASIVGKAPEDLVAQLQSSQENGNGSDSNHSRS